jgi:hypothetical protein
MRCRFFSGNGQRRWHFNLHKRQLGVVIAAAEAKEMRVVMPYKTMLCVAIASENIETGWLNLTKLNPIVLDTATGIGWD